MQRLIKKALLSIAGMIVMLAWWTIRPGNDNHASSDHIPDTVFGGGNTELVVEVSSNCKAWVTVTFQDVGADDEDVQLLEAWEEVEAGQHSWTIRVPEDVGGLVELNAREAQPGATLAWRLLVNGHVVDQQRETLDEPLEAGWAFALQAGFDEYSSGQLSSDW